MQVGGSDPLAELGDPERVAVGRGDLGRLVALLAVGVDRDLDQMLQALAAAKPAPMMSQDSASLTRAHHQSFPLS